MYTFFLSVLLFYLPLLIFPFGVSPFESPKVVIAEVLLVLLLCIKILETKLTFSSLKSFILSHKLLAITTLTFFVVIMMSLFQLNEHTLFGTSYRLQGIFLYVLLFSLLFISGRTFLLSWKVILGLLVVQLLAAVFIVGRTDMRAIGTLGEPNALAANVLFLWPWILVADYKNVKYEWIVKAVVILISSGIIFLSYSRSGMLGLALQLAVFSLSRFISLKKTVIIAVLLLICFHSIPFFAQTSLYENRAHIWQTAFLTGQEHPFSGSGIGNLASSLGESIKSRGGYMKFITVDSSHNLFLDWWVMGGILGVAIIGLTLWNSIKRYIDEGNILFLILLFGILTSMCFNPVSVVTLVHFWWIMGNRSEIKKA